MNRHSLHSPTILAALLASSVLLAACGRAGDETSRTAPEVNPQPHAVDPGATPASSDKEILGTLAIIDQNLVALAQQAIDRHVGTSTEDFARQMVHQHTRHLQEARALGAVESGQGVEALQAAGRSSLDSLASHREENPYRNAFIRTLVLQYAEAMDRIDRELAPAAKDERVRQFIARTRLQMAADFERAQAVASSR